MSEKWCTSAAGAIRLTVQAVPNANKTEVAGIVEDAVRIRLRAQPVDGKANETLTRHVAGLLGVPPSAVRVIRGHGSKRKTLEVVGSPLTAAAVAAMFLS